MVSGWLMPVVFFVGVVVGIILIAILSANGD